MGNVINLKPKCDDCPFRLDCLTLKDCCLAETLAGFVLHYWCVGEFKGLLDPLMDDDPTPPIAEREAILTKFEGYLYNLEERLTDIIAAVIKADHKDGR